MHRTDQRTACITGGVHRRLQKVVWRLGVALGADIAGPRPVCQHLRRRLIVSCRSSRLGSFARASPLRGRLPLATLRTSLPSASAPPSPAPRSPSHPTRCAPPDGHPSSDAISISCRRLARPLSANSEKARENVASLGSRPARAPAAQPAKPDRQPQDASGRASSECRTPLGYEGSRQRRAVLAPDARPGRGSLRRASRPVPNRWQLVALAHRPSSLSTSLNNSG